MRKLRCLYSVACRSHSPRSRCCYSSCLPSQPASLKRPLIEELRRPSKTGKFLTRIRLNVIVFASVILLLFGLTSWTILRETGTRNVLNSESFPSEEEVETFRTMYESQ